MDLLYDISALLLITIGFAHSYLGERYILVRLFRKNELPKLFGGTEFTKNTLRFAWHLTTIAWLGFAALLLTISHGQFTLTIVVNVIAITFLLHGLIAIVFSKGRHLSWLIFLSVAFILFFLVNR